MYIKSVVHPTELCYNNNVNSGRRVKFGLSDDFYDIAKSGYECVQNRLILYAKSGIGQGLCKTDKLKYSGGICYENQF